MESGGRELGAAEKQTGAIRQRSYTGGIYRLFEKSLREAATKANRAGDLGDKYKLVRVADGG